MATRTSIRSLASRARRCENASSRRRYLPHHVRVRAAPEETGKSPDRLYHGGRPFIGRHRSLCPATRWGGRRHRGIGGPVLRSNRGWAGDSTGRGSGAARRDHAEENSWHGAGVENYDANPHCPDDLLQHDFEVRRSWLVPGCGAVGRGWPDRARFTVGRGRDLAGGGPPSGPGHYFPAGADQHAEPSSGRGKALAGVHLLCVAHRDHRRSVDR